MIHTGHREEHDPYILASQAQMVYYMNDEIDKDWSVVVHLKPRDLYDMGVDVEETFMESEAHISQELASFFPNDNECMQLAREDVDNEVVITADPNLHMDFE